jgi:hypothetical protein
MRTRLWSPTLTLCLLLTAAPSSRAEDAPCRFTLTPAGEAFLRLDGATGAISVCSQKAGSFVCEAVADDVLALKREIDRLTEENQALREKLADKDSGLKTPDPEPTVPPAEPLLKAPEVDLDKMADLAARIIKRFQDMVRELSQDETAKEL